MTVLEAALIHAPFGVLGVIACSSSAFPEDASDLVTAPPKLRQLGLGLGEGSHDRTGEGSQ